jgi:hypothetical protein
MSMWVRLGPVSLSSRGRVGVRAGPISMYGGGGGRRSSSGGIGDVIALLFVVAIVFMVVMWPLSLWGHAIHLTPSWHQLMNRDHAWMHEHYALVGLRYIGAAVLLLLALFVASLPFWGFVERRAEERSRLQAAAAAEEQPETEPYLHPGQVPMLLEELHARGWKDERIGHRVTPYLPA